MLDAVAAGRWLGPEMTLHVAQVRIFVSVDAPASRREH